MPDNETRDQRLSNEIDRIIADYKRLGYDKAAICSQSIEIEEQAAKNLTEDQNP